MKDNFYIDMKSPNGAFELIKGIAGMIESPSYNQVLDVLEDGQALKDIGITDDCQEMVEEAHHIMLRWDAAGFSAFFDHQ